jgi:hypothetical protein
MLAAFSAGVSATIVAQQAKASNQLLVISSPGQYFIA